MPDKGSVLFRGLEEERFYFVHSYAAQEWTLDVEPPFPRPRLTWADHGGPFLAAVENGPLSATQFHPEKSGEAGIRLLSNWLHTLRGLMLATLILCSPRPPGAATPSEDNHE